VTQDRKRTGADVTTSCRAPAAGATPAGARRAVGRPRAGTPVAGAALAELLDRLQPDSLSVVFTHSSWTARRSESYERLAFLGDSVLGLAVTTHLFPRLDADRFGPGRLTKIRAQAVSGRSCRAVAERLGVPERLRAAAPAAAAPGIEALISTERVLASVIEAVIGACYLAFGYDTTAVAVVAAFEPEIEDALEHSVDYKSALQERLARRGAGAAARSHLHGQRQHPRQGDRLRGGPQQEGRRAGGRSVGAGVDGQMMMPMVR
jgi:ribonuclease III